jgi:hypothetical protein
MENTENQLPNELKLSNGYYVYLLCEPTSPGRKLLSMFDEPFVINILTPHLTKLQDASS